MRQKKSVVLLSCLMLSGCGALVKSEYQQPEVSVPAQWRTEITGPAYLASHEHWWDNFNDPQLSQLIAHVLSSNNDLAKAGLQLQQARLEAGLSNTNLTPDVTLSGGASNSKNLRGGGASEDYRTSLSLSYELDLWGKLARTREQAAWLVQASELDRQNVALTLIGNTADYYWQIAKLNQQLDAQQQMMSIAQETLRLVHARHAAGAASQIELLQARQSVNDRENQQQSLQQQREAARNALAILFNNSPDVRQPERRALDAGQDVPIAASVPLAVIGRRPDVQGTERRLRAALAGSDVARLNFYPSLSLTASLSAGSAIFQQWFSQPIRALGSSVALPFVQWNTMRLTAEKAKLDVQQQVIAFRSAVYNALSDVDNAMAQRLSYQQQKRRLLENLRLSQQRLTLAESQYRAGAVSFQTLLDAQDARLSSENSLAEMQYNYLNATMKLWLALGGAVDKDEMTEGNTHG
ncbi:efflux transporter outer membrane subunit [Serratia rhizosphaerae]|uniref:Efflux transporter outer membrane subunit n=1 Tax=Serratia rhizosphaerae TaxID=2597702 RepID=A0ABX6GPK4_9GAMM|nr:efflux transporter outer membrane subunit [Serratia rhizosphaerae]QHA88215.1 efflux transporter outer membrane subunit [Serratia rhizosphaerae]